MGEGVGVSKIGVGGAKRGSGVDVAVGGGVLVSVGRIKCAVGTWVSAGGAAAEEVKLTGVIYPVVHIREVPSNTAVIRIIGKKVLIIRMVHLSLYHIFNICAFTWLHDLIPFL